MKFPVAGPRQPVYDFLKQHGYQMSGWSDKHWTRHDGRKVHIYGAGSMARVFDGQDRLLDDGELGSVKL